MRTMLVAMLVALSLSACGGKGGSPTVPSDGPVSFTLTIRAARLPQDPIVGAIVATDDSREYNTDGEGIVSLSLTDVGRRLRVTAHGYTGPSTIIFRPNGQGMTHYLLPDDAEMPYSWLKEAFYRSDDGQWLWRPMPGRLDVELSNEGRADSRVSDALAWGSDTLNNAQRQVSFNVVGAGQTGAVKIYRDPSDPVFRTAGYENVWAFTAITTSGPVVVGARIVWKFFLDYPNSALPEHIGKAMGHELGHVIGIQGHPCCGGIMNSPLVLQDFSQQEKEAFGYLFLRPPGTRPPDNLAAAPQMSASSRGERREMLVCVLRQ